MMTICHQNWGSVYTNWGSVTQDWWRSSAWWMTASAFLHCQWNRFDMTFPRAQWSCVRMARV